MTEAPLVLAVPSKGRLQDNAAAYFARAGLKFLQPGGTRDYRGIVQGVDDVEVLFVSASEITGLIGAGKVHLGVTGEDLLRESIADADRTVEFLAPLGFGEANVVVAVPKAWIDVSTMDDLDDVAADLHHRNGRRLRVATKYINLTRRFFASHGVSDYIIVESGGATEGAPAAGTAEIIVDITTTGTTLAANGLKVLEDGVILRSQANLVAALAAPWSERARQAARRILARIAGAEAARELREVQVAVGKAGRRTLLDHAGRMGATMPFEPALEEAPLILHCAAAMAPALAEQLLDAGAAGVSVRQLDFVFVAENALFRRLEARLI